MATRPASPRPSRGSGQPAPSRDAGRPLWQRILLLLAILWLATQIARWAAPAAREAASWARNNLHLVQPAVTLAAGAVVMASFAGQAQLLWHGVDQGFVRAANSSVRVRAVRVKFATQPSVSESGPRIRTKAVRVSNRHRKSKRNNNYIF